MTINIIQGDENTFVGIDEIADGEAFLLTQVENGKNTDQILMNRQCAIELINELKEMIGEHDWI